MGSCCAGDIINILLLLDTLPREMGSYILASMCFHTDLHLHKSELIEVFMRQYTIVPVHKDLSPYTHVHSLDF